MDNNIANVISQNLEAIKQTAPMVYQAALRQTYLDAAREGIGAVLTLSLGAWVYKQGLKMYSEYSDEAGVYVLFVIAAVCAGVSVVMGMDVMDYILNPSYWAIVDLISRLKGQ